MNNLEVKRLHNELWRVLELLQRVNMLGDVDEEEFRANNERCKHIKAAISDLYEDKADALNNARALAAEYEGIF